MRVLVRAEKTAIRSSMSFSASGLIHATLLGLVVFGKTAPAPEKPRSLYDEMIRPSERHIVWYHLQDKLPEVRPAAGPRAERRPLRATRKFEQRIVAGPRDDNRPPQIVWAPEPEVASPKMTPLPNVLAVEMKKPARPFTPPAAKPVAPAPSLSEAPDVATRPAPAGPSLHPLKKAFTPPPVKAIAPGNELAALKDPGKAGILANGVAPAGPALHPLKKAFTPPPVKAIAPGNELAALKDPGKAGDLANGVAPAGPALQPLKKAFTAPSMKAAAAGHELSAFEDPGQPAALPHGIAAAGPNLAPLTKTFTAPPAAKGASGPGSGAAADLPAIDTAGQSGDVPHLAIVGLDPSKTPDIPEPPPSRTAGFSAGPKLQPDGAETDGGAAGIAVPGVTVRDGISRQALLANIRPMSRPIPAGPPPGPPPPTRVSSAPDASLEGRTVYSLALQMPNVTSYSGSWIVWFAERETSGGAMRAPAPLIKVDPKYIASAVADGVEGIVRLGAVIRKDGRVESVKLLRHLDERLDRSAMESLAKWQFHPAMSGGAPVDVDAVFEIPFRLAPRTHK